MDGCDFYDVFVGPLQELDLSDLAKLADFSLSKNWFMIQEGPEHTVDMIADVIYDSYMNSGACETWGPSQYFQWYLDGVISR
jgi:hypothetical protein